MTKHFASIVSIVLALAVLGCGQSIAQHPAPQDGWSVHNDDAGYSVELPKGWLSETAKDRHLMFHSADSKEFAYALPFEAPNGGSAGEWIQPLMQHLNTLLPGARIVQNEHVNGARGVAIAKVTFTQNGEQAQANVLCTIANGKGVFYVIAAPSGVFEAKKSSLCKVLGSVRPLDSANSARVHSGSPRSGELSYITWVEPNEHAFSVHVPQGWKITGGIFRCTPVDVRPQVDAGSKDGSIHLQFGDAALATFAAPGPSSKMRGLGEGQTYQVNGVAYTVLRPMNGADFSKLYVERSIGKKHADVKVTGTHDLQDEAQAANSTNQQQRMQVQVSCGESDFSYSENGVTVRGVCHVKVEVWGQGIGQTWHATPNTITSASDSLEVAKAVAERMVKTTVVDAQWTAQVQKTAADFNRLVIQNHEAAMQQIHDIYTKYTRSMDENQRQWSNIINNQADVVNKQTGQTMKVDGGYSYYYAGGGGIVGSNSANGGGLTPLTKY